MGKQDEEKQELTQEQVERAVEKLQTFYDSLPEDEKMVLESILSMAEGAEVTGHAGDTPRPIILSGGPGTEFGIFRPQLEDMWYVEPLPQATSSTRISGVVGHEYTHLISNE